MIFNNIQIHFEQTCRKDLWWNNIKESPLGFSGSSSRGVHPPMELCLCQLPLKKLCPPCQWESFCCPKSLSWEGLCSNFTALWVWETTTHIVIDTVWTPWAFQLADITGVTIISGNAAFTLQPRMLKCLSYLTSCISSENVDL